jgi:hypothetical protein
MIILATVVAATAGGLALVVNQLRKAPVGYEDKEGFHLVRQVKGSAIVRRRSNELLAGSLKGARAHS